MNILSKVTRKSLFKNKVRTVVTVIGILLSAAMITAVTVSAVSIQRFLAESMLASSGKWHVAFYNVDTQGREELEADGRTDSATWSQLSWAHFPEVPDGEDPYLTVVMGVDSAFMERMPLTLTAGRFPENSGEIVLDSGALGDWKVELGGAVTLPLGERVRDGEYLGFHQFHNKGETIEVRETRTYTVVGFFRRTRFTSGAYADLAGITVWDDTDAGMFYNGYILLKDPRDVYAFQEDHGLKDPEGGSGAQEGSGQYLSEDNTDYLMALGVSRYETFNTVLYSLAAILIGLIMFGSVSLIYNAFSISVAQRTREFGLLRSLGATKKQLRSMVVTEALSVSAVGIPLGVLSGILGMAVTFRFMGSSLSALIMDAGSDTLGTPVFALHVTPMAVLAAAVIGLVTVLISAWIPSRRATRVSAIDAIRQAGDVKIKPKEVKTSPLTYKLFGLEGAIAGKHFKRNRKGYRATVVSLFMSVVLFISASSFCRYLTDAVTGVFENYDYDISYANNRSREDPEDGIRDLSAALEALSRAPGVTRASAFVEVLNTGGHYFPVELIPERTREVMIHNAQPGGTVYVSIRVLGVEESTYRAYLQRLGLPEDEYLGDTPKLILRTTVRGFNSATERMESFEMIRSDLESLTLRFTDEYALEELWDSEGYEDLSPEEQDAAMEELTYAKTYEVGCVTDELPLGLNGNDDRITVVALLPLSEARRVQEGKNPYEYVRMFFTVSDHRRGFDDILSAAQTAGLTLSEQDFWDLYEETATDRSVVTLVRVVSYGFITLISLIAALNVFNTITTNILLRRREFAMLRSVGMTNRGFNRMMNYECLLYGAKALLFGVPVAFGVTYLIYRSVMQGVDTGFYLPWSAVAVAVGSVFLVVFASMLYSMSGIKKDNPIEAMKNEMA